VKRRLDHLRTAAVGSLVFSAVGLVLGLVFCVSRLRRRLPSAPWQPGRRLLVIGTFYNTSWLVSHVVPLSRCGFEEVVVVTDEPVTELERVRFACPPSWLRRTVGRPLAKAIWTVLEGSRCRPDVFMGYHVIPNSLIALLAARIFSRPACYQMTGGPIEVLDGGIGSENSWLTKLHRPSKSLERLLLAVVGEFDMIVVRGTSARRFLVEAGYSGTVAIVPGSVGDLVSVDAGARCYDMLYLGRFTETKRPLSFVEIAAGTARRRPGLRAVMVGDGPLLDGARARAGELGVERRVEFAGRQAEVARYVERAKVFVLTSRTEGLSIAMLEAMVAGAVPVVSRVGDLGDVVRDGMNGYLVEVDDVEGFVARVTLLLEDDVLRGRLSRAARESALAFAGVASVTALWAGHLGRLVETEARAEHAVPASPA
jgi:L-malate glycosyltransferase